MKQTRDVNEGYLVVHHVMAKALSSVGADPDLAPALASALDTRAARLKRLQAIV